MRSTPCCAASSPPTGSTDRFAGPARPTGRAAPEVEADDFHVGVTLVASRPDTTFIAGLARLRDRYGTDTIDAVHTTAQDLASTAADPLRRRQDYTASISTTTIASLLGGRAVAELEAAVAADTLLRRGEVADDWLDRSMEMLWVLMAPR